MSYKCPICGNDETLSVHTGKSGRIEIVCHECNRQSVYKQKTGKWYERVMVEKLIEIKGE